jgi:ubiquinone biosynthesis protein
VGWRGLLKALRHEAPYWAATLPQLPRLAHRLLAEDRLAAIDATLARLAAQGARRNRLLALVAALLAVALIAIIMARTC